jgi:hypothetical protein
MKTNDVNVYALSVVSAVIIAAIAIGGLTSLGYVAGTTSLTVTATATLAITNNTVDFGGLGQSQSNNTRGYQAKPFLLQNDGNVKLNVNISGTSLFSTTANPTSNYQFAANYSNNTGLTAGLPGAEGTCFDTGSTNSTTTLTNVPLGGSPLYVIGQLNYTDTCDEAEVEISVTVPSNEPTGPKSSTVLFVGST